MGLMDGRDALITPEEASRILEVNPKTVTRLANAGELKTVTKTLGGHRRYLKSEVEALNKRRRFGNDDK